MPRQHPTTEAVAGPDHATAPPGEGAPGAFTLGEAEEVQLIDSATRNSRARTAAAPAGPGPESLVGHGSAYAAAGSPPPLRQHQGPEEEDSHP